MTARNPMTSAERREVMLAAIASAPADADDWETAVAMRAASITAMIAEGGQLDKIVDGVATAKVFRGKVVSVEREDSSTRGIVTLDTGTDQARDGLPAGHEQVRTDRTDNPVGMAMARLAKSLVGRDVVVWVRLEPFGNRKVRVLAFISPV